MTTTTLIKKTVEVGAYRFRGLVSYSGGKHGSMQADMVLEKELRGLHLDLQAADGCSHLHSDKTCLTRPHLLIVLLTMGQVLKHMSLWGPFLFKPAHQGS